MKEVVIRFPGVDKHSHAMIHSGKDLPAVAKARVGRDNQLFVGVAERPYKPGFGVPDLITVRGADGEVACWIHPAKPVVSKAAKYVFNAPRSLPESVVEKERLCGTNIQRVSCI